MFYLHDMEEYSGEFSETVEWDMKNKNIMFTHIGSAKGDDFCLVQNLLLDTKQAHKAEEITRIGDKIWIDGKETKKKFILKHTRLFNAFMENINNISIMKGDAEEEFEEVYLIKMESDTAREVLKQTKFNIPVLVCKIGFVECEMKVMLCFKNVLKQRIQLSLKIDGKEGEKLFYLTWTTDLVGHNLLVERPICRPKIFKKIFKN